MEMHSEIIARKLWNVMRITFFMFRKSLKSKRKLIMHMSLMMKKGRLLRKSLRNFLSLLHHHHCRRHRRHYHHSSKYLARGYDIQEYEFSCSNSPNPVFFHMPKRKHHFNFPCINSPEDIEEEVKEEEPKAVIPKTPEYTFNVRLDASDFSSGEKISPLLSSFSVRISDYSSEDEIEEGGIGNVLVDDQAEDFIRRFYEQLRMQSCMHLLQYQEM